MANGPLKSWSIKAYLGGQESRCWGRFSLICLTWFYDNKWLFFVCGWIKSRSHTLIHLHSFFNQCLDLVPLINRSHRCKQRTRGSHWYPDHAEFVVILVHMTDKSANWIALVTARVTIPLQASPPAAYRLGYLPWRVKAWEVTATPPHALVKYPSPCHARSWEKSPHFYKSHFCHCSSSTTLVEGWENASFRSRKTAYLWLFTRCVCVV